MGEGIPAFSHPEWVAIIGESLVKRDLAALCGRLGLDFHGRRPDTLPEFALAEPLAEIVLGGRGHERDLIVEKVRGSNHTIAERVRQRPLEELKEAILEPDLWPSTATPGRMLWALKTDPREAVRELARDFDFVRKEMARFLKKAHKAPRSRPAEIGGAVSELREATERLAEITEAERRRADRDGRKIRDLEEQAAALRREIAERDERLAARKAELEKARGEAARAGHEVEALCSKLKAQPPESWESERRRLEHEVRALGKELEAARDSARAALEAAERQLQERLAAERSQTEEARRRVEAAEKEAAWLREKLKTPVAPPPPPRRDPDRVAIFAEVQSLYPLASARRGRIDYRLILERGLGGRRLGRALAYLLDVPGVDAAPFKLALHSIGYQVRSKPGRDPRIWTPGLEADLRDAARTCGRIAIATANQDLAGVLGGIAAEGVHVTLISFDDPVLGALRPAASEFLPIDEEMLRPLPARA